MPITKQEIELLTRKRVGETKLGEVLSSVNSLEDIKNSDASYVVIGFPEDVGVRANFGIGGSATAWEAFLHAFVNIQVQQDLDPKSLILFGALDVSAEQEKASILDVNDPDQLLQLRAVVEDIDRKVVEFARAVFSADKKLIAIGGGHNNSYGLLKGLALASGSAVNCINLDAHADFRALEGRHSGNGFSYAFQEGHLDKYAVVGLHKNYNSMAMLQEMKASVERIKWSFYEDLLEGRSLDEIFRQSIEFTTGRRGLELDLDSIAGVLSSAGSLIGFSVADVRKLLIQFSDSFEYLHLAEGAAKLDDGRADPGVGKLLATLVTDFLRSH